jgi:DNA repair protein RadC
MKPIFCPVKLNLDLKGAKINSSKDAYSLLRFCYPELDNVEYFVAMFLNRQNKVIGTLPVASGGLTTCLVDIRVVLGNALVNRASSIIVSHNHPSGADRFSDEDKNLTKKLQNACKLLDLTLLDHVLVVVNDEQVSYVSCADEGIL